MREVYGWDFNLDNMKVKIRNTEYDIRFTSRIGVYYTYEVEFGSSYEDDVQIMSFRNAIIRLIWAIIKTDNELVNCTFRELLAEVDDEEWTKIFQYIADRLKATASNEASKEEDAGKND